MSFYNFLCRFQMQLSNSPWTLCHHSDLILQSRSHRKSITTSNVHVKCLGMIRFMRYFLHGSIFEHCYFQNASSQRCGFAFPSHYATLSEFQPVTSIFVRCILLHVCGLLAWEILLLVIGRLFLLKSSLFAFQVQLLGSSSKLFPPYSNYPGQLLRLNLHLPPYSAKLKTCRNFILFHKYPSLVTSL